ncbi:MAG: hypothetical protein OEV40_31040 [Acidimicrobiia bacterium]|nr:hypothetical protein [Acidimicrobiia bacterium]
MDTVNAPWSGQRGWHTADWGPWGWAETVIKLIGIVVAVGAAIDDGAASIPDTHRLSYWLLFAVAVGYIGSIADRLADREVIAMGFLAATLLGHWSIVYAMGRADWPSTPVRVFAGLMVLGDLIKLGYFATTKTQVRGIPWPVPFALTGILVISYAAAFIAA